ncbi:RNA transcription regulation [Electric ant rhabdovirus]|uniref:RNA transcription regulation n=1 Tax=Electric ant rhabdovirus TaxID=3014874 RepID=A0AA95IYY7_9RHAB|nr:RNA transcription regulation [Electric ant rhabdovirus]
MTILSKIKEFVFPKPMDPPPDLFISKRPFKGKLTGYIKVDGILKIAWLEDMIEKLSPIIIINLINNTANWGLAIPHLTIFLIHILKRRLIYTTQMRTEMINQVHCQLEDLFLSQLSYIPSDSDPLLTQQTFTWELSDSHLPIILTYEMTLNLTTYNYLHKDSLLSSGYKQLILPSSKWEQFCSILLRQAEEKSFNQNELLKILNNNSKRLKKLLILKYSKHVNPFKP